MYDINAKLKAVDLYESIKNLPIISPHGHVNPVWLSENKPFSNPTELFLVPDHYVLRMLHSKGVDYEDLGVPERNKSFIKNPKKAWKIFCKYYYLFDGTPSKIWIDDSLKNVLKIDTPITEANADYLYDKISSLLATNDFLPINIFKNLNIELLATTEFALDELKSHEFLQNGPLTNKIITTYRPDDLTDPDRTNFKENLFSLERITGENIAEWNGLIKAHAHRRQTFRQYGAKATDHAAPSPRTADLSKEDKQRLLDKILLGKHDKHDSEMFRAQMFTEMAQLSIDDGMAMQMHVGSMRNTDPALMQKYGADKGADIPLQVNWLDGLSPLLRKLGNEKKLKIILFTLDESCYSRELAPMAGYWRSLVIGPPWWFHDSSYGIRRYFESVVETAGFYNLAGFNDDTRALMSIPSRHSLWRWETCLFLATHLIEGKISSSSAYDIAKWLSYNAAKEAYNLN